MIYSMLENNDLIPMCMKVEKPRKEGLGECFLKPRAMMTDGKTCQPIKCHVRADWLVGSQTSTGSAYRVYDVREDCWKQDHKDA